MQSIKFYSSDVKAIVTKKVAWNILWKQKKSNVIMEILSCDFDDHKFSKMDPTQDFTSNIFELHEPKIGGKRKVRYNFLDFTRLELPKSFRT